MIYYGIVDKLRPEHKSGIYGRRKLNKDESKELLNTISGDALGSISVSSLLTFIPFFGIIGATGALYTMYKRKKDDESVFSLQHESEKGDATKAIVIPNQTLNDYYDISKSGEFFYGLFDSFLKKNSAFEKIMKSKGGSELIIVERDSLPQNIKHFGGESGVFHTGLYCSHPKDNNQLIPLANSNELLKSIILEETLSAYQNLGAKKIVIEDRTLMESKLGGAKTSVEANASMTYQKEILREKHFGKGTFDPKTALENKFFIHDFPNIKTTLEGRISGNQTVEKFTETVNLNAGLDVDVLGLFKGNASFQYERKWYFEVEFYDKNEI